MSAGSEPARATFWLLDAPDSLSTQSHREPDGTGLGWFDAQGAPHVSKQAIAAYGDRRFAREAREVSSRTFVAHVRFASTGALELRNTHPFEQHGRLFAHNGVIEDLEALDAQLGEDRRLVKGDTDSERLFALITREIAARDGDIGAGIEAACRWVAANLPLFAINFVLASPDGLWALRYPQTHPLYVLERTPGAAAGALEQPRQPRAQRGCSRRGRWWSWRASAWMPTRGWRLLAIGRAAARHRHPPGEHATDPRGPTRAAADTRAAQSDGAGLAGPPGCSAPTYCAPVGRAHRPRPPDAPQPMA